MCNKTCTLFCWKLFDLFSFALSPAAPNCWFGGGFLTFVVDLCVRRLDVCRRMARAFLRTAVKRKVFFNRRPGNVGVWSMNSGTTCPLARVIHGATPKDTRLIKRYGNSHGKPTRVSRWNTKTFAVAGAQTRRVINIYRIPVKIIVITFTAVSPARLR